jgi:mono/diheme cytochrome c family protein
VHTAENPTGGRGVERRNVRRRLAASISTLIVLTAFQLEARGQGTPAAAGGDQLYEAACAACHGSDGRGAPPSQLGFDTPVPDFTDCSFATVEPDADWLAVAHDGGPARAFDRRMPAFGEALTEAELLEILDHIRGFCPDPAWPRGELNLPRALVTEKAYPENETVWTTTVAATGTGHVGNELLYEQRMGARSQFEILIPLLVQEDAPGVWQRGLGDVAFAVKHALYHSFDRGHIFSVAGEVVLPTGKETDGLGNGVTVFEPFAAFGQLLPADGFFQAQAGLELPTDTDRAGREGFWRAVVGKSFTEGRFGRSWSPMVELLAARDLEQGATTHWDLVPQVQVTLNRRQHLMINAGVRFPLNARGGRDTTVIAYFLWDWFDGGLLDGW